MNDKLSELDARVSALEERLEPSGTRHLSLKEAARVLGVHYNTAYTYVRDGTLEATKVGGKWRIKPDALEALQ